MNAIRCPIKELCFDYNLFGSCNDCKINKEINKCHKQIKRLKKQNETLTIQRNAWALAAERVAEDRKWISVNDRLPDIDELCLLSMENRITKYRWVVIGYYHTNYDEYVTHWMPLPEPPKESEGEK